MALSAILIGTFVFFGSFPILHFGLAAGVASSLLISFALSQAVFVLVIAKKLLCLHLEESRREEAPAYHGQFRRS